MAWTAVRVFRGYEIISTGGTAGSYGQRLLVFTIARQRAPAVLLEALLTRYPVVRRMRGASALAATGR